MMVYSQYRRNYKKRRCHGISIRQLGILFLIITTIILLFLKITTWLGAQELFRLKEIKVEGNRFIETNEILDYLEVDSSKGIFDIDLRASENQIRQHPLVEEVVVSRHLPSTLKINVLEKQPLALINNSKLLAVDELGNVLPKINSAFMCDYPIIFNLNIKGDKSNHVMKSDELIKILDYLRFLKSNYHSLYSRISEISFSNHVGVFFYLNDEAVTVLLGTESLNKKSANLDVILRVFDEGKKLTQIEYIDLRFAGQVITKERS